MGASAAAYLAEGGQDVALVSPMEGSGPDRRYSSHGDHSRVARNWSGDPIWRALGQRSLGRFRDIEAASGVSFFEEVGSLLLLPKEAVEERKTVRKVLNGPDGALYEPLGERELRERFEYLGMPGSVGVLEPKRAGYFDPRAFVQAQIQRGKQRGLRHLESPMESIDSGSPSHRIRLAAGGGELRARHVLLAMGSYSAFEPACACSAQLTVYGRTIIHIEVGERTRLALHGMPSIRVHGADYGFYLLPPIKYPDGKYYLKIGGGPRTRVLSSFAELSSWCAGDGDPAVAGMLLRKVHEVLPDLQALSVRPQTCIITVPQGGYPYITKGDNEIGVVTGGNGAGAKSGDELGRLAAAMMTDTAGWADGYAPGTFEP